MDCKVCGNVVNNFDRICSICGNDLEAQRRSGLSSSYSTYGQQNRTSSLEQEKEKAINRILFDNEGSSAKDRLEERRKKRHEDKPVSQAGLPSFFSHDRKESRKDYREDPVEPEQKPLRKFSTEFVFTENPKQETLPKTRIPEASPAIEPEARAPAQQAFTVPSASGPAGYDSIAVASSTEAVPDESFFALNPTYEELAKFEVDKKNEEFQELLDHEFDRLKKRDNGDGEEKTQFDPTAADSKSYIQERIDSYLKKSDLDMTLAIQNRETPKPEFDEAYPPARESISYDDLEKFDSFAIPIPDPVSLQEDNIPVFEPVPPVPDTPDYFAPDLQDSFAIPMPDFSVPEFQPAEADEYTESDTAGEVSQEINPDSVYWGYSRNEPPTKESIAAFLDRPIDFPFDEATQAFDFEPIESKITKEVLQPPAAEPSYDYSNQHLANDIVEANPDPNIQHDGLSASVDEPPRFYKEYTQGVLVEAVEAANAAKKAEEAKEIEPADSLPAFLTAYDEEQLGKPTSIVVPEKPVKKPGRAEAEDKKDKTPDKDTQKAEAKKTVLSVIITILIVVLVIFVACVIILMFKPDSIVAYYVRDFIAFVQGRFGDSA